MVQKVPKLGGGGGGEGSIIREILLIIWKEEYNL